MNRRVSLRLPTLSYYRTLFCVYLAVALLIFTFLSPPFQKVDEPAHFHRAVSLTDVELVCKKDLTGDGYFAMKRKYADLPDVMHVYDVWLNYKAKFNTDWLHADFSAPIHDEEAPIYRFCSLTPFGYVPNAFGVLLGKPFENPLVSFYLGRVTGALFFVLALVLALRTVPERYKLIVYAYAAMPTLLHQVTAFNYDVVQLSLFPVLFAYLTRFLVDEGQIRPKQLLFFMGLLWWLVNIRLLAYYPLILLYFVIPWPKIAPRFRSYAAVTAVFLVVTAVTTGFLDLIYVPSATDSSPENSGINASKQAHFVIDHPWKFVQACYKTIDLQGEHLFREAIGVFGWEDYFFNFLPYYLVAFIGGALVYRIAVRDSPLLGGWQLLVLFAALILTVASLFFSLYAVWSAVGADQVSGLQGRYFLGLLPFGVFWCTQATAVTGRERLLRVLVLVLVVAALFDIFRAVDLRYY